MNRIILLLALTNQDEEMIQFIAEKNIFSPYKEAKPQPKPDKKPPPIRVKETFEEKIPWYLRGFASDIFKIKDETSGKVTEKEFLCVWIERESTGEFTRLKTGDEISGVTIAKITFNEVIISDRGKKRVVKLDEKLVDEIIKRERWIEK